MQNSVIFLKINKKHGKEIHDLLLNLKIFNNNVKVQRDEKNILFPLVRAPKETEKIDFKKIDPHYEIEELKADPIILKKNEKAQDVFKEILSEEELSLMPHSFDIIGHVLVIDLPESLKHKEKKIAQVFLKTIKAVKSVVKKKGPVKGELRVRELALLDGIQDLETLYKENNCNYQIDISKVFFNPRLSTERMRIANLVKNNEIILDMFAGVGPFSCLIAKRKLAEVHAVDLNQEAIHYLKKNVKLNKVEHLVKIQGGDIRKIFNETYMHKFDRVIMNLPEKAIEFLDIAVKTIKKQGGIIYLYSFINDNDPKDEKLSEIKKIIKENDRILTNFASHKVRLVAPYEWQVCYELKI